MLNPEKRNSKGSNRLKINFLGGKEYTNMAKFLGHLDGSLLIVAKVSLSC